MAHRKAGVPDSFGSYNLDKAVLLRFLQEVFAQKKWQDEDFDVEPRGKNLWVFWVPELLTDKQRLELADRRAPSN
ncbi:hypothetical protein AMS68_007640 [Peltaster fructicola]|uniref:Uncharacterized protein n=1 Tax=Peltaster fructicola TaxID=286661 RepID=A0A6H0Y545_9PEZI|nr:hypothetical protein AMS68_007640 [Peltaster fructicola]